MSDELITITLKSPKEIVAKLDELVSAEDTDRSKFIRKLIRQEYERQGHPELENYRQKFDRAPKKGG